MSLESKDEVSLALNTEDPIYLVQAVGHDDFNNNNLSTASPQNSQSKTEQYAPYGTVIDKLDNVLIYANHPNLKGAYQCVEFVNRYYIEVRGIELKSVDARYYVDEVYQKGLIQYKSGETTMPPHIGDILVHTMGEHGHVAIVGDVSSDFGSGSIIVTIKQQNTPPGTSTYESIFKKNKDSYWKAGRFWQTGRYIEYWLGPNRPAPASSIPKYL